MEQISPAVAELQWPQEFGCLTGISGQAWQANDHVIAYLWVKTVPQNLRWNPGGGGVLGPKNDGGVPLAAENWTQKDRGKNEIWGLKDRIL